MSHCDEKTGVCETAMKPCAQTSGQCCCGSSCGKDPMACGMQRWSCSFHEAMKAVQVDILKVKIQKLWGSKFEKEANALLEVMEVQWKSRQAVMHAQARLKEDFHETCKGV